MNDLNTLCEEMRLESGSVNSDDIMVSFMYILMRDHLPPGIIENIIVNHCFTKETEFTNGWLAQYAKILYRD